MYTYFIADGENIDLRTFGNVSIPVMELETQNELITLPGGGHIAKFGANAPFAPRQLALAATVNKVDAERLGVLSGLVGRLYRDGNQSAIAELKYILLSPLDSLNQNTELYTASLVFLLLEFWNGGYKTYTSTFSGTGSFYKTIENGTHWAQNAKFECYCSSGTIEQIKFDNGYQSAIWEGQLQSGSRLIINDNTKSVTINSVDSYSGFSREFHGTKLRGGDWLPIPPRGGGYPNKQIKITILGTSGCSGTYKLTYDKRYK